eukprot:ANDGO_02367.mRNA.1 hypothetical protein
MSLRKIQSELHEKIDAAMSGIVANLGAIASASKISESHQSTSDALSIRVHADAIVTHIQSLLDVVDAVRMNRILYDAQRVTSGVDALKATLEREYESAMESVQTNRSNVVQALDVLNSFKVKATVNDASQVEPMME